MSTRVFVFGLGYAATAFAHAIAGRGGRVGGTVRTPEKAAALAAEGIEACVFDGTAPGADAREALRTATHLVISIAPGAMREPGVPGARDPVLAHHRDDILAARQLRWIGYLSTVGVYGDHDGEWVNETTPPRPERGRSEQRLAAEQAWQALADGASVPLAMFRIAGIYGPGRNALDNLDRGRARRIVKPGQVFNRIHVDDITQALVAALEQDAAGIFNLADDKPGPPQDVVRHAAELMGVAPPPEVAFETAELTPMARSFYGENKRVANATLKETLGVRLTYPTYRDGLAAMWWAGTWRGCGGES
ncbi:MAG: SDR family oxidoreductase [Alphaproteobacteria bacterium]